MNGQIRRLGIALMVLFGLLFAQLNWVQVVRAKKLREDPRNTRAVVRDFSQARGEIISADNVVLARSVPVDTSFGRLRQYPEGPLFGHLTGFFSFTYGSEGVERSYNDDLAGRTTTLRIESLGDRLLDRTPTANVRLTVSSALQRVAADALGDRKGAVVALDPRTGAVLAMVSFPRYDPNVLAAHSSKSVQAAREELLADPAKPLLARSYRERYFPGSTFKVVTTAAALANGKGLDTTFPVLKELDLPLTTRNLRNFGGSRCGGALPQVFKVSCNTAFAQLGLDLGPEAMSDAAAGFGFRSRPPIDLSPGAAESAYPEASFFDRNAPALAQTAIGQNEVAATPLQMALVAAAIANGGSIMEPHVMAEVRDSEGEVLRKAEPKEWLRATSPEVAATVRDLMVLAVNQGTGTRARIPGVQVAGKTGTAQTGNDTAHAWMIGFAPAEAPRVAVAVIVEQQREIRSTTGGKIAAPIVQRVIRTALGLP